MQGLGQMKLPRIGCRRLKNILENCTKQLHSVRDDHDSGDAVSTDSQRCSGSSINFGCDDFDVIFFEFSR